MLAAFLAVIFGMVSPKMMTSTVRITVAAQAYSSLPRSRMTSTEPSAEAAILARLLPMRMAESASSKRSVIFTAAPARGEPSSRKFSRRTVLHEE